MTGIRHSFIFIALAAAILAVGCRETVPTGRPTILSVERIIASHNHEHELVSSFNPSESKGAISVVGSAERSVKLVNLFIKSDEFDNIDGRLAPDQLPDFAGETVQMVVDSAHLPYSDFISRSMTDSLRSLTVHHLIHALDTVCSASAYEDAMYTAKLNAKMLVFTSPYMAQYGAFDVDTLCRALSADIPVIFPAKVVMSRLLDSGMERFHFLVVTDEKTAADGVHAALFSEMTAERGVFGSDCMAVAGDTLGGDPLANILEAYKAKGGMMPLSAIVVDDCTISAEDVRSSMEHIFEVQAETTMGYRKLLLPECQVLDVDEAATDECYRLLRSRNIFTHNIAYPQSKAYVTVQGKNGKGFRLVEK